MQPVQANKAHRHRRSSRRPREVSRFLNARAKSWPEGATKTRQYDLSRSRVGQKEPPRLGSTIYYGQTWARKSHQDSAVRFVRAKSWPERATKTRQYDLLRPRVGQKEPPRLGSTICYGQTWARKSHQNSAVRFVTAKSWPERATKTRQYDLLRPNVGQKDSARPPRISDLVHEFPTLPTNFPTLPTNFRPCPRISRPSNFRPFSTLPTNFLTLPTNFRACPRISRPCPRISQPCPRISLGF